MERVLDTSRQEPAQLLASLSGGRSASGPWSPCQQEVLQPLSAGPPAPCGSGLRVNMTFSPAWRNQAFARAGLQIQCYQCEEAAHDCSLPDYVVNCTVNVQDTCQQEVLVTADGVHYRKSCASSWACLISSSGYQQFYTGRLHSVCISCCSQPLCNGPRRRRSQPSASSGPAPRLWSPAPFCRLLPLLLLLMLGEGLV
ncbi:unnamed protein product [Boreogadus saida]